MAASGSAQWQEADLQRLLSLLHVSRIGVWVEHLHGTHSQLSHQVDPHMHHSSLTIGFIKFKTTQVVLASLHVEELASLNGVLLGARVQAATFRRMTPDTFSCRLELSTRRWYACRHEQCLTLKNIRTGALQTATATEFVVRTATAFSPALETAPHLIAVIALAHTMVK